MVALRSLYDRRAGRGLGYFLLALGLILAPAPPALAEVPAIIRTFTQENMASCQGVGGTPGLLGSYLTEAGDLNGDGAPDYVTDLAGLECANAWSFFCGSAGCPVTVWLSGPQGHAVGWGGNAQAWELRGPEVVLSLHGQLCDPPRIGAEGCEVVLRFDPAPPAPAQPAAPRTVPRASAEGAWRVRQAGSSPAIAEGPGTGRLSTLAALCLRNRPVMMATLADEGGAASVAFAFQFADRVIEATGVAGATTRRTYILDPRSGGLAGALAGDAAAVRLHIAGADQGLLSLDGSARALREALSPCLAF